MCHRSIFLKLYNKYIKRIDIFPAVVSFENNHMFTNYYRYKVMKAVKILCHSDELDRSTNVKEYLLALLIIEKSGFLNFTSQ
jgi:hypothetical protein